MTAVDPERVAIIATSLCDRAGCPGTGLCPAHVSAAEKIAKAQEEAAQAQQLALFETAMVGGE